MNDTNQLLEQARQAYISKNYDLAKERCGRVLQTIPENVEAMELLGLVACDENRLTESIEYLTKVTQIHPDRPLAFSNLGAANLMAGNTRDSLRHLETALRMDPDNQQIGSLYTTAKAQHRKRIPSFHINTLPKSGSMFIWTNIAQRLGIDRMQISCTFFPNDMIILRDIRQMAEGGYVSQSHLPASSLNKRILQNYFDRMIVHVRDPRQATLSWAHHANKYFDENAEEIMYATPPLPRNFASLSFEERLSWQIENHLPLCIRWIEDWLDAELDPQFKINILFTRYEDFQKDNEAFLLKILEFFDIPIDTFYRETRIERKPHFRKGQTNEWREVFTAEQAARATEMMTDRILERFGWER